MEVVWCVLVCVCVYLTWVVLDLLGSAQVPVSKECDGWSGGAKSLQLWLLLIQEVRIIHHACLHCCPTHTHNHDICYYFPGNTLTFLIKIIKLANPHLHCGSSHQSKSLCLCSSQGINTTLDISSLLESETNRDSKPNLPKKSLAKMTSQKSWSPAHWAKCLWQLAWFCVFNSTVPCWQHVRAKQQPAK